MRLETALELRAGTKGPLCVCKQEDLEPSAHCGARGERASQPSLKDA